MMRRILLSCLLIAGSTILYGQANISDSLFFVFNRQLSLFPQEKIYLHTDKPYYISGEKIWFRAYLADAKTHVPRYVSRYVYVELINPLDSMVARVKIRQEAGAYYGYLPIPDDVPEGDYTMRAFTSFMRNLDENYFCTKAIRIGDPQSRVVHTDTKFTFESNGKVNAMFRFSNVSPPGVLMPQSVKIRINNGKLMNVKIDDDGTASVSFTLPAASRKRVILLEMTAFKYSYRKFFQVPVTDDEFDVSFFPEGGSMMEGTSCKIAFKALKSNGYSLSISGVVYDQNGSKVTEIKSDYLGMGNFSYLSEKGKTYYAVCQNEQGQSKRFNLPAAVNRGYSLSVGQMKDKIYVSVLKPAENTRNDELYLFAHTRGIVHFATLWDQTENTVIIAKNQLPSGVLHLILFDAGMNPVSERLVFINNPDQAQVTYQPNRVNFSPRSLVKNTVTVTDNEGEPLIGSFSVAVTSDKEVTLDSTSNILTQLLLTSDLRGNIEDPAFYFQNSNYSAYALDLLMRTQGWRRYNIDEMAHGCFVRPRSPLEIGPEISGTVKSVLLGKPVENISVSISSLKGNYFDNTITDKDGRFYFRSGELPDSTMYIVSAAPKKGMTRMDLLIDRETFPDRTLPAVFPAEIDKNQFAKYADKAEQKNTFENGIRVYHLSEAVITAEQKPPRKSFYYSSPSNSITEEQIERFPATNIRDLLRLVPGVQVIENSITIRGATSFSLNTEPLLLVDDVPTDIENLDMINIFDIAQIDVLKDASNTGIFGSRGSNGVIVIYLKDGKVNTFASKPFNIKTINPLGYQKSVEFYAPKYDTPEKQRNSNPDWRTTIHWQPIVQTDSVGVASFEFYTADDESTTYTVVIEGLTNDGKIIRKEAKLWQKND